MTEKKTVLITGANGQLGSEFNAISPQYTQYRFLFVGKEDLPIDDFIAVENFFQEKKIDICINCAAYTAVDKAETEQKKAFSINADGVYHLALQCNNYNTRFIHISTDYVFDGTATTPITEEQITNPLGVYGASKLKGEQLALDTNPDTVIVRTSWVYSSFGNNFVKTMIRLMHEKEQLNVVSDQIGKPTYARDLAVVLMEIVKQWPSINNTSRIYNFSNSGNAISWYDFACAIKKNIKSKCIINPIPTSAYPTPAKRPAYSVLNTAKLEHQFNLSIPNWEESLQKCIEIM